MTSLNGKVAIVTGATSGIGLATAKLFAAEGARLVLNARGAERLEALAAEIVQVGGSAIAVPGDVRDEDLGRRLVESALERHGHLDVAFNNAGAVGEMGAVGELSVQGWRDTIDANLTGAFLCARPQATAMIEGGGGSIIFTSSFVGYTVGFPGMAAYAASKAGLIGLAKVMAAEHGAQGLRVNALLPGGTDTPAHLANAPGADPGIGEFINGIHALKRIATPLEIARAALFLASEASSFVTGTALLVDGGVSITRT